MGKFDEHWLRLALVIHETATDALESVLDNAISTKFKESKTFKECETRKDRLEHFLKTDKEALAPESDEKDKRKTKKDKAKNKNKFLLDYEVPIVFPSSGCPGVYKTFDVSIVCKLIKFLVGKAVFDKETASLPRKPVPGTKQPNIDFEKLETEYLKNASELALVEVIREYRNFIFHHTGSPVLSKEEFNHHWNNLMRTLTSLEYDVKDISIYQTLTLDYNGELVVNTIEELLKEAMRSMRDELASKKDVNELRQLLIDKVEWIGNLLGKFQADMQKAENVLNEIRELLPEMARKEELNDLKEKFRAMITTIEARLREVEDEVEVVKKRVKVVEEKLEVHGDEIRSLKQGLEDVAGIQNRPMNSGTLEGAANLERKQRAQRACKSVHQSLLKSRELDIFGDPMEGVRKSDLMVSRTIVKYRDLDPSKQESAIDIQKVETVAVQDLFKAAEVVLLRGHPGAGKSTLCDFILKEWKDGRLWSDQYDFVFYVNAPRLVTLLKEQPFDARRVLAALYPDVFKELSYEELSEFKCLVMVDAIDECDIERVCAPEQKGSEEAINDIITSSETTFHRLILGRPSTCDAVGRILKKNFPFVVVEVVGFTSEQVKEYVDKFCLHDKSKSENLWQRIRDNNTLLQRACLPIFANVICNVLSENALVEIETETELYVWSYFVLLTRHRIRQDGDKFKSTTYEEFFNDEKVIDELLKISEMAYENLRKGLIFFSSADFDLAGIGTTFASPFIVRYERYLSFSHLTQMEFFAAVHLFITSYESIDKEILESKYLQGVVGLLFGLLGGAVRNSDSAQIVRYFVRPLMERFEMKPLEKHPLCGDFAKSLFRMGEHNQIYFHSSDLHSFFEFQNLRLLKDCPPTDRFNGDELRLLFVVRQHHELDHVSFFMDQGFGEERRDVRFNPGITQRGLVEKRRVVRIHLRIAPFDGRFSEAECSKLRYLVELQSCNIEFLVLGFFSMSKEKMEILAPALVLVPRVLLCQISEGSWKIFLCALRNAHRNQTQRIVKIYYFASRDIPAAVSDELRRLDVECQCGKAPL